MSTTLRPTSRRDGSGSDRGRGSGHGRGHGGGHGRRPGRNGGPRRPGGRRHDVRDPAGIRFRRALARWFDWRSWRPYALLAAVLVAIVVAAGCVAAFTSVAGVRQVEVEGTHRLTPDQIRAAADISTGTPMVRLDAGAVRDRVAALTPVARVSVERDWPSTIRIRVTERSAAATLTRAGQVWLIDRSGVAFWRAAAAPKSLPRLALGSTPTTSATGRAAVAVAAEIPRSLLPKVISVSASSPDAVTLQLTGSRTVAWGTPEDGAAKAEVLPTLLTREGTTYDLSGFPAVVVR